MMHDRSLAAVGDGAGAPAAPLVPLHDPQDLLALALDGCLPCPGQSLDWLLDRIERTGERDR